MLGRAVYFSAHLRKYFTAHRLHDSPRAYIFISPVNALLERTADKRLKIVKQYPVLPYYNILQTLFFLFFSFPPDSVFFGAGGFSCGAKAYHNVYHTVGILINIFE